MIEVNKNVDRSIEERMLHNFSNQINETCDFFSSLVGEKIMCVSNLSDMKKGKFYKIIEIYGSISFRVVEKRKYASILVNVLNDDKRIQSYSILHFDYKTIIKEYENR